MPWQQSVTAPMVSWHGAAVVSFRASRWAPVTSRNGNVLDDHQGDAGVADL